MTGRSAFDYFALDRPLRVAVFQLEMPSSEDDRRFRRLALGCGIDPLRVPQLVEEGLLTLYPERHNAPPPGPA